MADDVDLANDFIDNAVARELNKIRQHAASMVGTKLCTECGDTMPKERKKLGFKLCVMCASEIERRRAKYA